MISPLMLSRKLAALAEVENPSEQPTEEEIDALERRLKLRIPAALRAYFEVMGRYRGEALMGTTTSFDKVEGMTADARTTMKRWGKELPKDAIVFMSHQGYDFTFVRSSEEPNPTVYRWVEGEDIRTRYESILDFVEALFPPV